MSPQWNNVIGYASVVTHQSYCSVTSRPFSLTGTGFPSGTSASKAERFLHISTYYSQESLWVAIGYGLVYEGFVI